MKRLAYLVFICMALQLFLSPLASTAEQSIERKGPYLVVEGNVIQIFARRLVIDNQQYPISMFARVFEADLNGREISLQSLVDRGKIDLARLYILGGKVEKIVVLKNI